MLSLTVAASQFEIIIVHIHVQPTPQREDEERENHETRLELSSYGFDFVHCREKENILPDTLFKATCTVTKEDSLFKLHHRHAHQGHSTI